MVVSQSDSEQVLDLELWSRIHAAVADARQLVQAWVADRNTPPTISMPVIRRYISGFPMLFSDFHSSVDGPPRYSRLFGHRSDLDSPLAYSQCPALAELIRYVLCRNDLIERLIPIPREQLSADEEWLQIAANVIAHFALAIMDRAEALGVRDEDDVRSIYIELERSLLATELAAELVVPLALTRIELEEPLIVAPGIRIEPMDEALNAARAPSTLSQGIVPLPVVSAATHAIVIEDVIIPNCQRHERVYTGIRSNLPLASVNHVVEALRVLTHIRTGYAQVLVRPVGWADGWIHNLPAIKTASHVRAYPESFDDAAWLKSSEPIDRATIIRLPNVFQKLQHAKAEVKLAARRLSQAELRMDGDDKTVDACIGLEALLSGETTELSHRLSLRAAAALAENETVPWDSMEIYRIMKSIYNHRSAIVHGAGKFKYGYIKLSGKEVETPTAATMMLRLLLLDIIERANPWTPETLDHHLLRSLDGTASQPQRLGHNRSGSVETRVMRLSKALIQPYARASEITMKIAFGADDNNECTRTVIEHLRGVSELQIIDVGGWSEFARKIALAVASGEVDFGIVMCWTGTGTSIAANKVAGVRAALAWEPWIARNARLWNDANVLALSLKRTAPDVAVECVKAFLEAEAEDPEESANIDLIRHL